MTDINIKISIDKKYLIAVAVIGLVAGMFVISSSAQAPLPNSGDAIWIFVTDGFQTPAEDADNYYNTTFTFYAIFKSKQNTGIQSFQPVISINMSRPAQINATVTNAFLDGARGFGYLVNSSDVFLPAYDRQ